MTEPGTSGPPRPGNRPLGAVMRREIAEQPARWRALLRDGGRQLAEARAWVWSRPPRLVLFAARGTSDHAALYGSYLVQTSLQVPAASASPSVVSLYHAAPDLRDVLVVAVSQSGGSPDLVSFVRMAGERGARSLAVVNEVGSPLAALCDVVVDVAAGPERAVAATKSYTAELLGLAALFAPDALTGTLAMLPDAAEEVLDAATPPMTELAARYRFATRIVTAARGFSYASAKEAALKLTETSYVSAHGLSAADLLHGPVAMLDESVPLLCFASAGPDAAELQDLVGFASTRGIDVDVVGDGTVRGGVLPALLPAGLAPELRPILEILPAQLLAVTSATARGYDPDAPRGLSKVTRTY